MAPKSQFSSRDNRSPRQKKTSKNTCFVAIVHHPIFPGAQFEVSWLHGSSGEVSGEGFQFQSFED